MEYKIGWPFWEEAYKLGATISFSVKLFVNKEKQVFCAYCPDVKGAHASSEHLVEAKRAVVDSVLYYMSTQIGNYDSYDPLQNIDKKRVKVYFKKVRAPSIPMQKKNMH